MKKEITQLVLIIVLCLLACFASAVSYNKFWINDSNSTFYFIENDSAKLAGVYINRGDCILAANINIIPKPVTPSASKLDLVLITDTSTSMTECMDTRPSLPNTSLLVTFNDGTVKDSSKNNFIGAATSGAKKDTTYGMDGTSFVFDGITGSINYGNIENPGTSDFTIALWFSWNATTGDKILYNKEELFEARVNNGWVQYAWKPHWVWDGENSFYCPKNKWCHLAITYNHTYQVMYQDGKEVYRRPQTGNIGSYISPLYLGRRSGGDYFKGHIDEFTIYNKALSPDQIRALMDVYNCPNDGNDESPSICKALTHECPASCSPDEESYCSIKEPGSYQNLTYGKVITGYQAGYTDCSSETSCSGCSGSKTLVSGGYTYVRTACLSNECDLGPYQSCSTYAQVGSPGNICTANGLTYKYSYSNTQCRSSCYSGEADQGSCTLSSSCTTNARSSCGMQACSPVSSTSSTMTLRSSCYSSECDEGTVYTNPQCIESFSCPSGYTSCSGCSCQPSQQCCCPQDSTLARCAQYSDTCCTPNLGRNCLKYYDYCCTDQRLCQSNQLYCCDLSSLPVYACQEASFTALAGSCQLGFSNGQPALNQDCKNSWQCVPKEGQCYLCDSVRIRLAKKLDKQFITSLFNTTSPKVGLVEYGSAVTGIMSLTNDSVALASQVNTYTADSGATCISCAINKSLNILKNSTNPRKYLVLMSDGEANTCIDGSNCGHAAIDEAIDLACNVPYSALNQSIKIFSVSYMGSSSILLPPQINEADFKTQDPANYLLWKIANCTGGSFHAGTTPDDLVSAYSNISGTVINEFSWPTLNISFLNGSEVYSAPDPLQVPLNLNGKKCYNIEPNGSIGNECTGNFSMLSPARVINLLLEYCNNNLSVSQCNVSWKLSSKTPGGVMLDKMQLDAIAARDWPLPNSFPDGKVPEYGYFSCPDDTLTCGNALLDNNEQCDWQLPPNCPLVAGRQLGCYKNCACASCINLSIYGANAQVIDLNQWITPGLKSELDINWSIQQTETCLQTVEKYPPFNVIRMLEKPQAPVGCTERVFFDAKRGGSTMMSLCFDATIKEANYSISPEELTRLLVSKGKVVSGYYADLAGTIQKWGPYMIVVKVWEKK